jgi:hypothetical protein
MQWFESEAGLARGKWRSLAPPTEVSVAFRGSIKHNRQASSENLAAGVNGADCDNRRDHAA